jgi:rubrerythrin
MRIVLVTLAVLALAGCGAQQKSADTATTTAEPIAADTAATTAGPIAAGTEAVVAAAPQLIETLTNQKLVYECPKCGMDFDAAGTCSMGCAELVATKVDYICPQDGQAVEQAGTCPRCPMNARVEKTAMAAAAAPGRN